MAARGINTLLFDVRREFFSPFDALSWLLVPHYLVAQALFFLGAAWFRKTHFVKTVGAVVALASRCAPSHRHRLVARRG